ncbi:hypothetical protein [Deinococcus radiotolerans]|uniref:Uncharacterized protein n=1 Tax=Deinococcus radiotolerans TaxID=1309407 RepID=A0ABQ2FRV3_9DEIO|nr:hypothetical protein [Deinococcus radiotolerans]GGL20436.1 hypothetical protein GCM10010844_44150 [Deinococcus radiotolerans]
MILTICALILGLIYTFIRITARRETPPVSPEEYQEFQTAVRSNAV